MTARRRAASPRRTIWVLAAVGALAACRRPARPVRADGGRPPSLVVLPGAENVGFVRAAWGQDQVSYELRVADEAHAPLSLLAARLKAQGWTPQAEDFLNPGEPVGFARGWTESRLPDKPGRPETDERQWLGDWRDADGDVVRFLWLHDLPAAPRARGRGPVTMRVLGLHLPAALAAKERSEARSGAGGRR